MSVRIVITYIVKLLSFPRKHRVLLPRVEVEVEAGAVVPLAAAAAARVGNTLDPPM